MKRKNTIRYRRAAFDQLRALFEEAGDLESQSFTLFSRASGPGFRVFIGNKHILPGPDDLEEQSGGSVQPTKTLQAVAYGLAFETGLSAGDEHTHPFSESPHFSSIDDSHGRKNAIELSKDLPEPATMLMVVFGRGLRNFEARVWNRQEERFEPIERLEILGSPIDIVDYSTPGVAADDDPYARHRIIPGWKQGLLERLKVLVVGLGGNGALVWQSLLSLGVGSNGGWLKACDPDHLEVSNLPRIPYAYPKDIGESKAAIAQRYARRKMPGTTVACYQQGIEAEQMQNMAKEANVIFGCLDNDGARKILNSAALRYGVPYVDTASEIIPEDGQYHAMAQVQTLIPGQTGCLLCSGAIDPSTAALDLISEDDARTRALVGYVRGTSETPTPSVLHLNGVISNLAISQFLRIVFGENAVKSAYIHYDRQAHKLLSASVPSNADCPACGLKGYLGAGDGNREEQMPEFGDQVGRFNLATGEIAHKDEVAEDKPSGKEQLLSHHKTGTEE